MLGWEYFYCLNLNFLVKHIKKGRINVYSFKKLFLKSLAVTIICFIIIMIGYFAMGYLI